MALARATMAALKRQGARVAARLETMPVQLGAGAEVRKDLAADILSWLFPPDEARLWADSMRLPLRETVRAGFRDGAEQLGDFRRFLLNDQSLEADAQRVD